MYYNFKCESCNKVLEVEIPISDYDKEKENAGLKAQIEKMEVCENCAYLRERRNNVSRED